MNNVVPLLVAIPLGVAFVIPLAVRCHPRLADVLSNLTLLGLLLLCFLLPGREMIYHMGGWPTPNGIDLRVDALTTLMLLTINGLALIVGIYSVAYMSPTTIAKIIGKSKMPSKSDIDVAVEIRSQGTLIAGDKTTSGSKKWWTELPQAEGLVLDKTKTPFAPLWWDRYAEVQGR